MPAAAGVSSFVIRSDVGIGSFAVRGDGSLGGAIAAFGRPASLRRDSRYREACTGRWPVIGIRTVFYNLGLADPCSPKGGRFSNARLTGARWRTAAGLHIGDAASAIRRHHPRAEPSPREPGLWWLVTRTSPFGSGGQYGGLSAEVVRGRVSAFVVVYPAGGD